MTSTSMSSAAGFRGAVCGGESGLGPRGVDESVGCDVESGLGLGGVAKGAVSGGESGLESGGVSGALYKAGRSGIMEPRRAERGGGSARSE